VKFNVPRDTTQAYVILEAEARGWGGFRGKAPVGGLGRSLPEVEAKREISVHFFTLSV